MAAARIVNIITGTLKKSNKSFLYFYKYLNYRLFVAVAISLAVGVLDGFGLAMFLPLLEMVNGESIAEAENMGNLSFLVSWLQNHGIYLTLSLVLGGIAVFFILKGIAKYFQGIYQVYVQQYFIKQIRLGNITSLGNISFKYFVNSDVGRIQNTLSGEADRVARSFMYYSRALQDSILVAVYMGFVFFVDWQFALLVTMGGLLSNVIYRIIYKHTRGLSQKLTLEANLFQGLIIQAVANFKYLKATGQLKTYNKKLAQQVDYIENNNKKIGELGALLIAAREPITIMVVCAVILIQTNVMGSSLASILVSLLFLYRALNALTHMQTSVNSYTSVSGSLDNMDSFGTEMEAQRETTGTIHFKNFKDQIELKNCTFRYGDTTILNNINLEIQKNQTVAFVGESGGGKTTLINILSGLLPLDEGQMLVDGIDSKQLDIETYQEKIGYITQDPVIFNDSIYNNITFWAEKTPENVSRFWEACRKAAIEDFIRSLKGGEELRLGNNGINLSGGQKQRIAIARELFKNIEILILDEATSALDSQTEREIQENIDVLKGRYTIFVIAHRLSTVKNADYVVFMKKGEIISIDTFNNLALNVPSFAKLVNAELN